MRTLKVLDSLILLKLGDENKRKDGYPDEDHPENYADPLLIP